MRLAAAIAFSRTARNFALWLRRDRVVDGASLRPRLDGAEAVHFLPAVVGPLRASASGGAESRKRWHCCWCPLMNTLITRAAYSALSSISLFVLASVLHR